MLVRDLARVVRELSERVLELFNIVWALSYIVQPLREAVCGLFDVVSEHLRLDEHSTAATHYAPEMLESSIHALVMLRPCLEMLQPCFLML
jgi:hypothetical protein